MKQAYHSNAITNLHLRTEINKSNLSNDVLAKKYNTSTKTIAKWKKRVLFDDKTSRPKTIHYSLSDLDQLIVTQIRSLTWWSLDEITEIINPEHPQKIRSAVYRTFVREGVNKVPQKQKQKAKKFKEYDPGYLHIDVTYLPKIQGVKYYLFVAIDRATRLLYYQIYDAKTSVNAEDFMKKCIDFFPVTNITHVLTDNGLEFTNRLITSKKGKKCTTPSKMDVVCADNDIEHRLIKPYTPQTNGMVEKVNDTIKKGTIKKHQYDNLEQMKNDLTEFLIFYNLYRRHGGVRKELQVKTPFNAMETWYQMSPEIFKETPENFKLKIINLTIS